MVKSGFILWCCSTPFFLDRPAACFVVCMPAPLRCGNPEMHETFPVHVRANNNIRTFCSVAHLTFQILSQSLIKGSKSQEINHTQDQEAAKQVIIQLNWFPSFRRKSSNMSKAEARPHFIDRCFPISTCYPNFRATARSISHCQTNRKSTNSRVSTTA